MSQQAEDIKKLQDKQAEHESRLSALEEKTGLKKSEEAPAEEEKAEEEKVDE